jgi:hypothetical protein
MPYYTGNHRQHLSRGVQLSYLVWDEHVYGVPITFTPKLKIAEHKRGQQFTRWKDLTDRRTDSSFWFL